MLERAKAEVGEERSSRKSPLSDREARELLARVERVLVARGRKTEELTAARARPADLKGPTGSYRAPMVVRGGTLLVGFNPEALEGLLAESA